MLYQYSTDVAQTDVIIHRKLMKGRTFQRACLRQVRTVLHAKDLVHHHTWVLVRRQRWSLQPPEYPG